MSFFRGCLLALTMIASVGVMPATAQEIVGKSSSSDELAWRGRHHHGQRVHHGPRWRHHQRPHFYRPYYYRPYYYRPYYNDPYYYYGPRSGFYIQFRT